MSSDFLFCTSAAGAGLTGSKMATRIGSLEEFELKEVGGVHQGIIRCFSGLGTGNQGGNYGVPLGILPMT
ncbi:hypothetical protein Lalb_Chr08g0246031 [Lupinus albus]|uniref:Uncharacterized protein n=1 Tax=Lupinus albus TaxID=3870 RepID=A0A6A4Q5J7_LUPAL|nr:hypothetical protein Lalb_Chr08g0246031 [Lupinus albus]